MKKIMIVLLTIVLTATVSAENVISIGDLEIEEGQTRLVEIGVEDATFHHGQVCIEYDDSIVKMSAGDCGDYGFVVTAVKDDSGYVAMYTGNKKLSGDHVFGSVKIRAIGGIGGTSVLEIVNVKLFDENGSLIPSTFAGGSVIIVPLMGDINNDKNVDIIDVVSLFGYVAGTYEDQIDEDIADMNGDGNIDMLDVIAVLRRIVGV